MPELLEVIESLRAEEASVQRLFASEGTGVRSARRRSNPRYMQALAEAATLIAEVYQGRRPFHHFQEAMTTSDFPDLFGDVIDRQILANYREYPTNWQAFTRRGTVSDFRTVKRFFVTGAEGQLLEVGQHDEYPEAAVDDSKYTYSVKKYGRKMVFSWETMMNRDLDLLNDMPQRMARAARRTEQRFITDLYVGTTGPDATFFAAGNSNVVTSNPVLSITALQTAMTILAAQRDADGEPIFVESVVLVVPPSLEITAQNIMNATQLVIDPNAAAGTAQQQLWTNNWMRNRLQLVVDPYIPVIASSSNGNTSWFLFANPNNGRPAMEVGFLRGHEEPEVFMKVPNQRRVGGGGDDLDGSFELDGTEYKVRHVLGGTLLDPKMAVASNGSGS